jgi:hypothetical protein
VIKGGVSKEGGTCAQRVSGHTEKRAIRKINVVFLNFIHLILLLLKSALVLIIEGNYF